MPNTNPHIPQLDSYVSAKIALDVYDALCCIFSPKISSYRVCEYYTIEQIYVDNVYGERVVRIRIAEQKQVSSVWTRDAIVETLTENSSIKVAGHEVGYNLRGGSCVNVYCGICNRASLTNVRWVDDMMLAASFVFHQGWFEIVCAIPTDTLDNDETMVCLQSIFTGSQRRMIHIRDFA